MWITRRWLILATIAMAAFASTGASSCKHKERNARPVPSAGEVLLAVVERERQDSPEADFKDKGGVLRATYQIVNSSVNYSNAQTRSFTGTLKIPVSVKVDEILLSLSELDVADSLGARLVLVNGEQLTTITTSAKNGVALTVVLTRGGTPKPELRVQANSAPPADSPADQKFRSIKEVFPDPRTILIATDIPATLALLKQVASATPEYHAELVTLVQDAATLDVAHLNLVLDACYFPLSDYEKLTALYEELSKKTDDESKRRAERVVKNLQLAEHLSNYTNSIAGAGLPKIKDLSYEAALTLLVKLYPSSGADAAFDAAIRGVGPLSPERKPELMALADTKKAVSSAGGLALSWFNDDSDHGVTTLSELAKKLQAEQSRAILLLGATGKLEGLTLDQAKALIPLLGDGSNRRALGEKLLRKLPSVGSAELVAIAALVPNGYYTHEQFKDALLKDSIALLPTPLPLGVTDVIAVMAATPNSPTRASLAASLLPRVQSLTGARIAEVAAQIQNGYYTHEQYKEDLLKAALRLVNPVSVDDIKALVGAAAQAITRRDVATALFPSVAGLTGSQVAEVSLLITNGYYTHEQFREDAIKGALPLLRTPSVTDLQALLKAAQSDADRNLIGKRLIPLVANFTGAQLASIAALVGNGYYTHEQYREDLLKAGIASVKSLSVEETSVLLRAAQQNGTRKDLVVALSAKIPGLTGTQLADLSKIVENGYYASEQFRDEAVLGSLGALTSVTASDLKALLNVFGTADNQLTAQKRVATKTASLSASELKDLLGVVKGDAAKAAVALALLAKVPGLTGTQLADVAGVVQNGYYASEYYRENLLLTGAATLSAVAFEDLKALMRTAGAQASRKTLATTYGPRIPGLTGAQLAQLAALLENGYYAAEWLRDQTIVALLPALASTTSADTLVLLTTAGNDATRLTVATALLGRTSDLTVADALAINGKLSGPSRDSYLVKAVDRVTDLSAQNLMSLANATDSQQAKDQVLQKGLKRLGGG